MRIWIVEDDTKRGPFEVFAVRERIERGELTGTELAWHEALDEWTPLRELDVFESEFARVRSGPSPVLPPPLPLKPHPFLRLCGRAFDLTLYSLLLWGGMKLLGLDLLGAALSPLFNILSMLPCFVIEAALLHLWGTTPGKALLGIEIRSAEDEKLAVGSSILRALRVYIIGLGLLQPILTLLCGAFSLWFTLRNGLAPWDVVGRNRVRVAGPTPASLAIFVLLFLLILGLLVLGVFLPLALELQEAYPQGFPAVTAT